ncbi:hypothetical protein A8709_08450 [Paenibacillus pectinilyticus]|uniref:Uncharacterized protein n=1 Tax=Paenibacillus pectinilyticus TaxID=512399 RepID=A0A1C1A826_9BACL|nr:hypothetical protein A8709_08450 [Paenibacillus pectinilyticus]
MKFSWKYVLLLVLVIIVVFVGTSYLPHRLIHKAAEVSKIIIFNGGTGVELELTNKDDIEHIINNLRGITFQKGKSSFGYMGFSFKTTVYDKKGKPVKQLIINSEDTVRYKGYFYKAKGSLIDYTYIKKKFEKLN